MDPYDPTDSSRTTHEDNPAPAGPPPAGFDAARFGNSGLAGATPAAPDPIRDIAGILAVHGTDTIERMLAEPSDLRTRTFLSAGPSPAAATPTVPGYDLLEPLGEGGMGIVWKARQTKLNRVVALKMVLGGQHVGSRELIRFLAEAEAVAAIRHPHVVQVFDYGEAAGRPFLAMEYLSGGSLSDRLKPSGRLDPKVAAELVATLAGAVQAAHDQGIVHRDLKPGNVLYDERGQPKVTDFGLAKRAGGSDLTATQAVMGTPAYMAPEQARGETKFVGPQADVYSLGVILYRCLTGTRPFDDPDPLALLLKVAQEEPERPRKRVRRLPRDGKRVRRLPRDVELICLKCLAKDPGERYATAGALEADLGRFVAGETVSVRAAGVVERVAKWARRKPTLAAAYTLGLLSLLLGGLGGAALWQWRAAAQARDGEKVARVSAEQAWGAEKTARASAEQAWGAEKTARSAADRARVAAEKAQREAEIARDGEKKAREQLAAVEYGRTMQVAHQEWRDNHVGAAMALLESTPAHLRGWEWRYIHRLCHSDLLTLKGHSKAVRSASFSPDGSRIVTASLDSTARVWDANSGAELLTLKGHKAQVRSASFSPDGARVVTWAIDATAKVWDAKSGTELLTFKGGASSASFSPDGSRIVTGSVDQTAAQLWNAKSGARLFTLRGHTDRVTSASFSPDGSRIVTGSVDQTAMVWDAQTRAELSTLKGHTGQVWSASFSPDGSRIVTGSADKTAKVWDAKSGAELFALTGHTDWVWSASFSGDGSRVVTASQDHTARVWDANSGAGLLALRHTDRVWSASFSPDGSRVVTASDDQTAKVWDPKSSAELLALKGHTDRVNSASFSPDGSHVVTASNDRTAKIWDATSGAELLTLKGHTDRVNSASFSSDGSRVITGSSYNFPKGGTAKVWDAKSGAELLTLKGHTSFVNWASFISDGSRVVTVCSDQMRIWTATSGTLERLTKVHTASLRLDGGRGVTTGVNSVSFSPDGSCVVTGSAGPRDATAKIWDLWAGYARGTLNGHTDEVWSVSFSADGSRIVTGSADKTAKVWDAKSGAELLTLRHAGSVVSASFSADRYRVVTASFDQTKIWDATSGAELLTLKGHTGSVDSASFSRDRSRIVTAGSDNTANVWDATPINGEFVAREFAPPPRAIR